MRMKQATDQVIKHSQTSGTLKCSWSFNKITTTHLTPAALTSAGAFMDEELSQRAERIAAELRLLAIALTDLGHPGISIRLQGFAGYLTSLPTEVARGMERQSVRRVISANSINASPDPSTSALGEHSRVTSSFRRTPGADVGS